MGKELRVPSSSRAEPFDDSPHFLKSQVIKARGIPITLEFPEDSELCVRIQRKREKTIAIIITSQYQK